MSIRKPWTIRGRLFVSFRIIRPVGLIRLLMAYKNVSLVNNLTCNKT